MERKAIANPEAIGGKPEPYVKPPRLYPLDYTKEEQIAIEQAKIDRMSDTPSKQDERKYESSGQRALEIKTQDALTLNNFNNRKYSPISEMTRKNVLDLDNVAKEQQDKFALLSAQAGSEEAFFGYLNNPKNKEELKAYNNLKEYHKWSNENGYQPFTALLSSNEQSRIDSFWGEKGTYLNDVYQIGADKFGSLLSPERKEEYNKVVNAFGDVSDSVMVDTNVSLMSSYWNINQDEIRANYDVNIQAFNESVLGRTDEVDTRKFYSNAKGWLSTNVKSHEAREEVKKTLWEDVVSGTIKGETQEELLNQAIEANPDVSKDDVSILLKGAADHFNKEYGEELQLANNLFNAYKETTTGDKKMVRSGEVEDLIKSIAVMPKEFRNKIIYLTYKIAENQAGDYDAGVGGKMSRSFARGLYTYINNQMDFIEQHSTLEQAGITPYQEEWEKTRVNAKSNIREFRQDLRDIENIVEKISSDNPFVQGLYDLSASAPYTIAALAPMGAGIVTNTFASATEADMQMRNSGVEDPNKRAKMSLAAGALISTSERVSAKFMLRQIPALNKLANFKTGAATSFLKRVAGAQVAEQITEGAQAVIPLAIMELSRDLHTKYPEVPQEEFDKAIRTFFPWTEEGSRVFFATLPLATVMAGGVTFADNYKGGRMREVMSSPSEQFKKSSTRTNLLAAHKQDQQRIISNVDRLMLAGLNEEQAISVSNMTNLDAQKREVDRIMDKTTKEEQVDNSERAAANGAIERVAEEDAEYYAGPTEKAAIELEQTRDEFIAKYEGSVQPTEDGRYKVIFPDESQRPNKTFDTQTQANVYVNQVKEDTDINFNKLLAETVTNLEAVQKTKKLLTKKQDGAEFQSDLDKQSLQELVNQNIITMDQAMERASLYLLQTDQGREATAEDLKNLEVQGQVRLRESARGYVAELTKGANVTTVLEEGSEGFIRDLVNVGAVDSSWLKGQIAEYEMTTGDQLTGVQSAESMTDTQMVEAFSTLAQANFWNKRGDGSLPKGLSKLIDALRRFFAAVLKTAENLATLKAEGKLNGEFEMLLDQSVGIDNEQQIERMAKEELDNLTEGTDVTFAVGPVDPVMERLNVFASKPEAKLVIAERIKKNLLKVRNQVTRRDPGSDLETAKRNLAQMEAIYTALPSIVRGQLRGFKTIAELGTANSIDKYLIGRIDRAENLVEKYLQKEYRSKIETKIKKGQTRKDNKTKRGKSKAGVAGHRILDTIKDVKTRNISTEKGIELKQAKINEAQQEAVKNLEVLSAAEIAKELSISQAEAEVYELFSDFKKASSAQLEQMFEFLEVNWNKNRAEWQKVLEGRIQKEQERVDILSNGFVGVDVNQPKLTNKKDVTKWSDAKYDLLSEWNKYDLLQEQAKDGKSGKKLKDLIQSFTYKGQKADEDFMFAENDLKEWSNKTQKEVFGFKGLNAHAQTASLMSSYMKPVDYGDKITINAERQVNVAANREEIENAIKKQEDKPNEDFVKIRKIKLTIPEFNIFKDKWNQAKKAKKAVSGRSLFKVEFTRNKGERKEVGQVSQGTLLAWKLGLEQPNIAEGVSKAGQDEIFYKQILEQLDPNIIELGQRMVDKIAENKNKVKSLFESENGLPFKLTEGQYFPVQREHEADTGAVVDQDGQQITNVNNSPNFLIKRVNNSEPMTNTDAFTLFDRYMAQYNFWTTHAVYLRELSFFNRRDSQKAIMQSKGRGYLNSLNRDLRNAKDNYSLLNQISIATDRWTNALASGHGMAVMGANATTIIKNLLALFNVAYAKNFSHIASGIANFNWEEFKTFYNSKMIQVRLKGGASVVTRNILEASPSGSIVPATLHSLGQKNMQLINIADTGASLTMYAAYKGEIVRLRKISNEQKALGNKGFTEQEISEMAMDDTRDMMNKYAQPISKRSRSSIETSSLRFDKWLFQFMSERFTKGRMAGLAIRSIMQRENYTNAEGRTRVKDAMRRLSVLMISAGVIEYMITAFWSALTKSSGEGEDFEERFKAQMGDWKSFSAHSAKSLFTGVPIIGKPSDYLIDQAFDQKTYKDDPDLIKKSFNLSAFKKVLDDDSTSSEITQGVIDIIQSMTALAPQTAVLAQSGNVLEDLLGIMNNADVGFTEEDTNSIIKDRAKKIIYSVNKESKDEYLEAKENDDKNTVRSITQLRKFESVERILDYLNSLSPEKRSSAVKSMVDNYNDPNGKGKLPKYVIMSLPR